MSQKGACVTVCVYFLPELQRYENTDKTTIELLEQLILKSSSFFFMEISFIVFGMGRRALSKCLKLSSLKAAALLDPFK